MLFHVPTPPVIIDEPTHPLFVYGTLQNPLTQITVFGRYDAGIPDILFGYRRELTSLGRGMYPSLQPDQDDFVTGLRIAVTPQELDLIDDYETSAYHRTELTLRSGHQCWVYMQASQA